MFPISVCPKVAGGTDGEGEADVDAEGDLDEEGEGDLDELGDLDEEGEPITKFFTVAATGLAVPSL